MNKGMIMLGLLLIVGLSFATLTWQYGWQGPTYFRYDCNLNYMAMGQYNAAYYYMPPYATVGQLNNMYYYLGLMRGEASYMQTDFYATPFRADMAGFNSANSLFRSVFNAAYRAYFAATGDQGGAVRNYLAAANAGYRGCINPPIR